MKTEPERHYANGAWAAFDGYEISHPNLSEAQRATLRRLDASDWLPGWVGFAYATFVLIRHFRRSRRTSVSERDVP